MLNCRQATQLMSESQDRPLAAGEKLALKLHTLMCRGCRNFEQQLPVIRRIARRYADRPDHGSPQKGEPEE
ncbi:zf-HC2 domain-containing protein [Zobellella sp. An-6]|uniref:zf-HC2 domain-containing protein n=1 Tax=Zobellella sp. An-6 TaxID=3400218 RepID=UPI004041422E